MHYPKAHHDRPRIMRKLRTPKGGIGKRKVYHCSVCDVNLYFGDKGGSPKSRHEKTGKHVKMAQGGVDYERCPRCELNVFKNYGKSALYAHLKKCALQPEEFYVKKGGHSVCRELLELMELAYIPNEKVIKAREEREALLDKNFNSAEEEAETEEESVAPKPTTSKKVLFATAEELLFKKLPSGEVVKESMSRLRHLFAVEMVANLRKKGYKCCL